MLLFYLYASYQHHSHIEKMYKAVGQEYEDSRNMDVIEYSNPITHLTYKFFAPKAGAISVDILTKGGFYEAGFGDNCSALRYTGILRPEINASVYENSEFCCMPPIVTDLIPVTYDNKNDELLFMCGLAGDGHVVALKADDLNRYFVGRFNADANFDIRDNFLTE